MELILRCPSCLNSDTKVLESRVSHEGRSVSAKLVLIDYNTKRKKAYYPSAEKDGTLDEFNRIKSIVHLLGCRKRQVTIDET